MLYQVLLALVVVAATTADPGDYGHSYPSGYMPYHFNYGVSDHYKATDFGQHENSDGKNVWGTYWVNLPDGRKQRVSQLLQVYLHSNNVIYIVHSIAIVQLWHSYLTNVSLYPQVDYTG
ncbi:uncharacterized protein [Panulirus ornatus]|uniref:uncharacterized protein n=1 Tax=Panulirus ornatus TaxID=150431 RepID=UPI003A88DD8C